MKKFYLFVLLLPLIISCGGNNSAFPVEKRYWSSDDYLIVNQELTSLKYNDKELPNLDNPETAPVFKKIIDTANFSVVINDNQLGIKHRSEFSTRLFEQYKDMVSAYSGIDRTDKYQYPLEYVEIFKFGLPLQLYYIKLNNEDNVKEADDPSAPDVIDLNRRNGNVLIRNYEIYLDLINYEERFTDKALIAYSEGLKNYFPRLINYAVPNGDYSEMTGKIEKMLKKSKHPAIIFELQNILTLIKMQTKS